MNNINNEFPLSVIIPGDFKCSMFKGWKNDIPNSTGEEIDSLTSSAGYK